MQINVILDFDDKELGEDWFTEYDFISLLYTNEHTYRHLLKIVQFKKDHDNSDNYFGYLSGLPSSITEIKE